MFFLNQSVVMPNTLYKLVKNAVFTAFFVLLPISACGTIVQLSAEIDKFYLTFSTSASLSKNKFFDKLKGVRKRYSLGFWWRRRGSNS